jgi:hypothetical protein
LYANRSAYRSGHDLDGLCIIVLSQTQAAWVPLFYARALSIWQRGRPPMIVGLIFLVTAPAGQWLGGLLMDHLRAAGHCSRASFRPGGLRNGVHSCRRFIFCTSTHIGASEAGVHRV